jgi:hypothetical protein
MTAPRADTPVVLDSTRARDDWMYAASETSPAAQPNEIGMNVAAIFHASLTWFGGGR